jgi:acyl-CoA hydrolase
MMAVESLFVVRASHLNHEGHLFGGELMAAMDEIGYCAARMTWPRGRFVTRAAEIQFVSPARLGDMVRFHADVVGTGTTSLRVAVTGCVDARLVGSATMTYVNLDARGCKQALPRRVAAMARKGVQ